MTVTIPTQKQDTTNLYHKKVTMNRSLIIFPEGGKVTIYQLQILLDLHGQSINELSQFEQKLQGSMAQFPMITTSNIDTSMFNEVFYVNSVVVEDLIGDISELIKTEVFNQMPQIVINDFTITLQSTMH